MASTALDFRLARGGAGLRHWGDPERWFTEGRSLRNAARRARQCVECGTPLPSRRTPYCSRKCQWKFCGRYFWDAARSYVMRRDRYTCQACRQRFRARELEVDHIVELARGGAEYDSTNLQTLCRACHRTKTARFLRTRHHSRIAPSSVGIQTRHSAMPEDENSSDWFPA